MLVAAATAAPAGQARVAHPGNSWYWGTGLAEYKLLTTIQAAQALSADDITSAECEGIGVWIYKRGTRTKLYKHLRCFIQWTSIVGYDEYGLPEYYDNEGERVLHVLGTFRFTLSTS